MVTLMAGLRFYQDQGKEQFRAGVKSYSSATDFFGAIYTACDLTSVKRSEISLMDGMSGPGKLALDIKKRYEEEIPGGPSLRLAFNDARAEALESLKASGFETVACDIREIDQHVRNAFDRFTVRYGIKDLPEGQAEVALRAIHGAIAPGGKVILGEMTADSIEAQRGIIQVHGTKQILAGRNVDSEGWCFIPTVEQWVQYAEGAGFTNVSVMHRDYSKVAIENWRGQFGKDANDDQMLEHMRGVVKDVATTNQSFKQETNAQQDDKGEWHIDFPIFVLVAEKRA